MLYLYLAVSKSAASGALVREDDGIQKPVYYISYSMNGPQRRYQRLEKLVLALFIISRKLKALLSNFPYHSPHGTSSEKRCGKPRGDQEDTEMGIGAEVLRTQIRAKGNNQRPSPCRLHHRFPLGATEQANQPEGWILNVDSASNNKGQGSFSPHRKDQLSNNPSLSASRHPTTKPSMKQS